MPLTFEDNIVTARNAMIAEQVAEHMMTLKDVGVGITRLAVICGSDHAEWLKKADGYLQEIFDSSREEFFPHFQAAVSGDDDTPELSILRNLVEMVGNL